jgi:hypothetical protein
MDEINGNGRMGWSSVRREAGKEKRAFQPFVSLMLAETRSV